MRGRDGEKWGAVGTGVSPGAAAHRCMVFVMAAAVLLAAGSGMPASALEQTGDITGTVRGEKGLPLRGATLEIRGDSLQGARSVVSDERGEFTFRLIPPGAYTLRAKADTYATIEFDAIVVNVGRATTVPISFSQGTMPEIVRVVGTPPLIDRVRTTTQSNFDSEYLEKVDIVNGQNVLVDYLGLVSRTPGAVGQSIRGGTSGGNVYLIDGVDSTDPFNPGPGMSFISDAMQEVQIQSGGIPAEFGRMTGGVVNIVTKSGGNAFSGSVDARYLDDRFYENGDHFRSNPVDLNESLQGELGGPIVKDKLWFFLGGLYGKSNFSAEDWGAVRKTDRKVYEGKLSWQPSPSQKFVLQSSGDPWTTDNADLSAFTSKEATSKWHRGSAFTSLRYEGIPSPSVIVDVQAAYYHSYNDADPQSGDLHTIGYTDFFTGVNSHNAQVVSHQDTYRNQASASLTWVNANRTGGHTFKFGADLQDVKNKLESFATGGEYDTVCFPPQCPGPISFVTYTVFHSQGTLEDDGLIQGYYAQDEWRIHPQITINAGLRYDAYDYANDTGKSVFNAHLLQPRLGLAFDVTGDAKNVVKVFGGVYADTSLLYIPYSVNSRANLQDLYVNELLFGDVNGDGTIEERAFLYSFGGPGGEVVAHGGNLDAAHTVEYQASYERLIGPESVVSLTGVRRRTSDLIEDEYDQGRGQYVIDNRSELGRNYYGAELRYRTRWKKLFLVGSYTWSKFRGNVPNDQSLGTDFDFPVLGTNRYGYMPEDRRHVVLLNGYWLLPIGFQISYAYTWSSGAPWQRTAPALPYGDEFIEPRGSERLPSFSQLDLDLRKRFSIGHSVFELSVAVLNAFDTETALGVLQSGPDAGEPFYWQQPRRFEVRARYTF